MVCKGPLYQRTLATKGREFSNVWGAPSPKPFGRLPLVLECSSTSKGFPHIFHSKAGACGLINITVLLCKILPLCCPHGFVFFLSWVPASMSLPASVACTSPMSLVLGLFDFSPCNSGRLAKSPSVFYTLQQVLVDFKVESPLLGDSGWTRDHLLYTVSLPILPR